MKKIIFSGIQPTGAAPHIGNYLGALKQWVELQKDYQAIYFLADLHAITVPQNPQKFSEAVYKTFALLLSLGIDPKESTLFVQSQNPYHTELTWILNCFTSIGELSRMTQYKDKAVKQKEIVSAGLFSYPVLMAADILLYDTDVVPVGEDQVQHVELARKVAERYNSKYGETFKLPMAKLVGESKRIMSLADPTKKMSKSDENKHSCLFLLDSPDEIAAKIRSAVTDSQTGIVFDEARPGLLNLLNIYKGITNKDNHEVEEEFLEKGYKEFKEKLAETLIAFLEPLQKKYFSFMDDKVELKKLMEMGRQKTMAIAEKKVKEVKEKVGFVL